MRSEQWAREGSNRQGSAELTFSNPPKFRGASFAGIIRWTALLGIMLASHARGANRMWVGGDNDWDASTTNWNAADEPDSDDAAIFNTSHSVDLVNAHEQINGLTLSGGINLNLNGNDMTVEGPVVLGGGSTFLFVGPSGSVLNADGATVNNGGVLGLRGGTVTINEASGDGSIEVNAGGVLNGDGIISFTDAVAAETSVLVNDGTLLATFATPLDIDGSAAGTLTINASDADARVDLDGGAVANGVVSIARNDTLDVNVSLLDAFGGTIDLAAGATLDIEDAWTLNLGEINVNTVGLSHGTAGPAATINGGALTLSSGFIAILDVTDTLRVACPLNAVTGHIANNGKILFDNTTTIGTAFSLLMGSTSHLEVNATVTVNDDNWDWDNDGGADNVITIGPMGRLNVDLANGLESSSWSGVMQIDGGILNVDGAGLAWRNRRTIELAGGELRGTAAIENDDMLSRIRGYGLISARVDNDAFIVAENGTLVVETAGNDNDWDGVNDTGTLQAITGDLELRDNAQFTFTGTVSVFAGQEVFVNGFRLDFVPGSGLGLINGRYRSNRRVDMGSDMVVGSGTSTVQTDATMSFTHNSTTELIGDLTLDNERTIVKVGAEFFGGGALMNAPGRTLQLDDGITAADLAVTIVNNGVLAIEEAEFMAGTPAQVQAVDYEQTASGGWALDVGGVGLTAFDRFTVTGAAVLDGALELSLVSGFVPTIGNTFSILSAAGGVNGAFDAITQPAGMPAGLTFSVVYNPTLVQLQVIAAPTFTADFDQDGDVDAADLAQWQGDFGVNDMSDADNDGDSDGADFLQWQRQLGSGLPGVAAGAAVPEPSSCWIAVTCGALLANCWKRQRDHRRRGVEIGFQQSAQGGSRSYSSKRLILSAAIVLVPASRAEARLLAVDFNADALVEVDPGSAATTAIGSTLERFVASLDYDRQHGTLYGTTTSSNLLVRVNPATGVATEIGPLGIRNMHALGYDPTTDLLYGGSNETRSLYQINRQTGLATLVGPMDINPSGMAFDPVAKRMYVTGSDPETMLSRLYTVNLATGSTSLIGAFDAALVQGMHGLAIDPKWGMFGTDNGYGLSGNQLFKIDPASAAVTLVGTLAPSAFPNMLSLAFVPEPATCGMFAVCIGIIGVASVRRR